MQQRIGSKKLSFSLMLALASVALPPQIAQAQWNAAAGTRQLAALAPAYQGGPGWRQQVRVASPYRNSRWNAAPPGAVRVYNRRFDSRWQWRSAPRHHVVYTYYRGDVWFLDPTTGWAYSVDRYGIVYTADPYRGWVYSLGPLTRWTADLLYFFDLYRFDRGYWYCRDYDYFVDLWEDYPRYGYYTYDTAYSTLWGWEPYFSSPTFISYSNRFSTVWVRQVRSHYDYIERNPYYRRELIDNIGLPAVQAAPPRMVSPRAVATTAYWEARDLAAAGMAPPPRGRDAGPGRAERGFAPGTMVDAREAPSQVVESGAPAPGFNAPLPDGSYGFGVRPGDGSAGPSAPAENGGLSAGGRGREDGGRGRPEAAGQWPADVQGGQPAPVQSGSEAAPSSADPWQSSPNGGDQRGRSESAPQFEEPSYPPPQVQADAPKYPDTSVSERAQPVYVPEQFQDTKPDDSQYQRERDQPRYEEPVREEPRFEAPREEPRYEAPKEEPRYEAPREEPRYEAPREEPRYEAPREEPRYEEPAREEPRYEAPREEPRYEEPAREEPRYEEPAREESKESRDPER